MEMLLGVDADPNFDDPESCPWVKSGSDDQLHFSKYSIRLKWLRTTFSDFDEENAGPEEIDQYTRAFCLDLFGSVLFPDLSENAVPALYLQFLEFLEDPPRWNWGEAVLACLYSHLTKASLLQNTSIGGPLVFLMFWSWNHIPVGRPVASVPVPVLGGDDPERRPPLGIIWATLHNYRQNSRAGGVPAYREQLDKLDGEVVNWTPYQPYYELLPKCVYDDFGAWLCRRYLVHIWVVEFYHGDRVMRQFGLYQTCPPPPPLNYEELKQLRKVVHSSGRGANDEVDWSEVHKIYMDSVSEPIIETRQYDSSVGAEAYYMAWFYQRGMPKLYFTDNNAEVLSQPMPPLDEPVESLGYVSHAQSSSRAVR